MLMEQPMRDNAHIVQHKGITAVKELSNNERSDLLLLL